VLSRGHFEENKNFGLWIWRPGTENARAQRKQLPRSISIIFLAYLYGDFEILGKFPKTLKTTCFWVRLMLNGFLAGEPRLGCRKVDFRFLSGQWKPV
jgi:hypothetical protein